MSVDFYVTLPVASWPTAAAVQKCMSDHAYPAQLKRFPALNGDHVVTDGALASVDGKDAYLEGELAAATAMPTDVKFINDRLAASASHERIKSDSALMSVRVRSLAEMRAASYVVSALIVCFDGFGFESQGNTSGRAAFARSLLLGAEALKGR
ncbi:hypothetical protein [Sphingomonas sp. BK069]|uniref:hypothetical protein n=1 Tax=Sphingomonas sp. BK069 TaxID=2586979 RepID=UPI001618E9FE|nr:hypothetical protein [Sphingomonas sp. BK069]MBB3349574.1 hypothetical protein [Sphingomonas sp. BK069]